MTEKKRGRGRPATGVRFYIQKHVFLDQETADMLKALAEDAVIGELLPNESAYMRELIQREFKKTFS